MTERMARLADAAIRLVAAKGMRGLTHRAVDAEAGVPPGSTSAYFRTRKALVEGVVRRLAALSLAELGPAEPDPAEPHSTAPPIDLDDAVARLARLLDRWSGPDRERTLARYACLLEATHHPELRGVLAHGAAHRAQATAVLAAAGAADPRAAGRDLVAFLDGLLFDRLVGAGAATAPEPGTPENLADLTRAIRSALRGVLGG
ncbi:TetR family transcriptional regulator [Actinosynnema sp. NPDC020468]|uniref:TetR/AcrR family transcriptional regulator n=1 Tax=Actinosynnema sp. NPDC020468 TaxID=3154488 RepID=UPI0033C20CFC